MDAVLVEPLSSEMSRSLPGRPPARLIPPSSSNFGILSLPSRVGCLRLAPA